MSETALRRYTHLAPLIHLLHRKSLTLLNPGKWDDKNDAYFLEVYRRKQALGTVLALCFAECAETYHHWYVFAGTSGVCLEFAKERLVDSLCQTEGVRCGSVKYPLIKELGTAPPDIQDLPFVKRFPFKDEREFRIILETEAEMVEAVDVPFDPMALIKVTMNPWTPRPVFDSVKAHLEGIKGWSHLTVARTSLIDNDDWKKFADIETLPSNQRVKPTAAGTTNS